ncbi:MAG: hypothetical protein GY754_38660 [bacterium]|nr:hypothetical protein [bacterium]
MNQVFKKIKLILLLAAVGLMAVLTGCDGTQEDVNVYVSGGYRTGNVNTLCYWVNGEPVELGNASVNDSPTYISVSGNDIYAAAGEKSASTTSQAVYWKNEGKTVLNSEWSSARAIAANGDDLYMLVNYWNYTNPEYFIWKNGDLTPVEGSAYALKVDGDDVYYAGRISRDSVTIPYYAINGVTTEVPEMKTIADITINNGDIYLTGLIGDQACVWKNGEITMLSTEETKAAAICVDGSDVYVAGTYYDSIGIRHACYWKNGALVDLGTGKHSDAKDIAVYNGDVYIAGDDVSGSNNVYVWKNDKNTYKKMSMSGWSPSGWVSQMVIVPK